MSSKNPNPSFLALVNISGGLFFGYNLGIIAYALSIMVQIFTLDDFQQGILTSAFLLGTMIGSLSGGAIADALGRKRLMLIWTIVSIGTNTALAFSPNYVLLCILRVILGAAVGWASVVCPMYVSESAPADKRGFLGSFFQLAITFGILISYVFGYFMVTQVNPGLSWRLMFGMGGIPGLFGFLVAMSMRESNAWIRTKEKKDRQPLLTEPSFSGEEGLNLQHSASGKTGIAGLCSRESLPTLFITTCLAITLQMTGINAIMLYAPSIFQASGIQQDPLILTIIVGGWNFLITLIAVVTNIVERLGRRPIWLVSVSVLTVALLVVGFAQTDLIQNAEAKSYLSLAAIAVFIAAFAAGPGILFWIIINEIFPAETRDYGSSYANVLQWTCTLLIGLLFPTVVKAVGQAGVFFGFGGIGVVMLIIFFIMLPETRAKSE
jgi:sugar porter (SP) family MFS transporter